MNKLVVTLSIGVLAGSALAQMLSSTQVGAFAPGSRVGREANRPPVLLTDLPQGATTPVAFVDEDFAFALTAIDPDGDPVTVRLLNPPPTFQFQPSVYRASPAVHPIRWQAEAGSGGLQHLVFEAHDDVEPDRKTRLVVPVHVMGEVVHTGTLGGDVTGDGRLDVVGVDSEATVGGVGSVGSIGVWTGDGSPEGTPSARLQTTLNVVNTALGRIHLGTGGPATAGRGQSTQLADVTGDGILDVVVTSTFASQGPGWTGAVYVWHGGASFSGLRNPDAELIVPGTFNVAVGTGRGLTTILEDVDADGVRDVLLLCTYDAVGGTFRSGSARVWYGGGGLTGTRSSDATLRVPGAQSEDFLGYAADQALHVGDVTGDGATDVVIGSRDADVGGVSNSGAVYVWAGGSTWAGDVDPTATLFDPLATSNDALSRDGLRLHDVTGDGVLDVLASSRNSNAIAVNGGAVYLFAGGPGLSGPQAPTARLGGAGMGQGNGLRMAFGDVDGDTVLDVVTTSPSAGPNGEGEVYVWAGGVDLAGDPAPTARLSVFGASPSDGLTNAQSGRGIALRDVTGDGILDVVALASNADVGGVVNTGAAYVWRGGPGLSGSLDADAYLTVPGALAGDRLGTLRHDQWNVANGNALTFEDVTGDGVTDVVIGCSYASAAASRAGAHYVWAGGASLSGPVGPLATLVAPVATPDVFLGATSVEIDMLNVGQSLQFGDVTGDGQVDVISAAPYFSAGIGSGSTQGAVFVWSGGASLVGNVTPAATLSGSTDLTMTRLGGTLGQSVLLAETSGDGVLDLHVSAPFSNTGASPTGAIFTWNGGVALAAGQSHSATASLSDGLGQKMGWAVGPYIHRSAQGIFLLDRTGDGLPEVLGVSSLTATFLSWEAPFSGAPVAAERLYDASTTQGRMGG